ncbi:MAG: ATP-binding protein [Paracoccaceae bacterium]
MRIGRYLDSLVVALTIVTLSTAIWWTLDTERDQRISDIIGTQVQNASVSLKRDIELRVSAMSHLGSHWDRETGLDAGVFTDQAKAYMREFPGLRALSFGDAEFVARYVEPSTNSRAIGRNIANFSPSRRNALETARDTGEPTMSEVIDLVDGSGPGFIIFVPLLRDDEFIGTINVVFHASTWINSILVPGLEDNLLMNVAARIRLDDIDLFVADDFENRIRAKSLASNAVNVFSRPLSVELVPRSSLIEKNWAWTPEIFSALMAGLLMGLWLSIKLMQRANRADARSMTALRELAHSHAALTREVDVRRAAEQEAHRAREGTSRFLATMSHEIRTPLNAIMGMFQLIERGDVTERVKRQASTGYRASERLFAELSNVIDVTRLDTQALTIHPVKVETRSIINEWRSVLVAMIERSAKPVSADVWIGLELPEHVEVDPMRVSQIVINLLDNAVKFTETGYVEMQVDVMEENTDRIAVMVSDTGPGIPPNKLKQVFARFYQINEGPDRLHEGSGLGLTICRDLADLMHGTLTAENLPERGARFTLTLPTKPKDQSGDGREPCADPKLVEETP